MNIQSVTQLANKLQNEMPFMDGINSSQDHQDALAMMDELTENGDHNLLLIDLLWPKIEQYEETAPELSEFNDRIGNMEAGASMLRVLMSQHQLKTSDFQDEIGAKSVVSMIANEKRKLTADHIKKLSLRFDISPALFF
jgi:HTH-type transcriptional regulator/antitoxin HigA